MNRMENFISSFARDITFTTYAYPNDLFPQLNDREVIAPDRKLKNSFAVMEYYSTLCFKLVLLVPNVDLSQH